MDNGQVNINLEANKDELLEDVDDEEPRGRLKSVSKIDDAGRKIKGRGFKDNSEDADQRYAGKGGEFEELDDGGKKGPLRSVEGFIIIVTNIHEEASEDDIHDKFSEFGVVKNLQLPLDRRTGFVKGYALVEYETLQEAEGAIKDMDGAEFMDHSLHVDWTFTKGVGSRSIKRTRGRGDRK